MKSGTEMAFSLLSFWRSQEIKSWKRFSFSLLKKLPVNKPR